MKRCPVCLKQNSNWLHELSCRSKNALAWLLYDSVKANDKISKQEAIKNYWQELEL